MSEGKDFVQIDLLENWFLRDEEEEEDEEGNEQEEEIVERRRRKVEEEGRNLKAEPNDASRSMAQNVVRILVMLLLGYFVVRFILGAWIALFIFLAISAFFISLYLN